MREHVKNRLWGASMLLLGLAGLGYSGWILVLAANQEAWIPVTAQAVASKTTWHSKGSGFTQQATSNFAYQYEVAGKQYTASRYSFWSAGPGKFEGTKLYQVGDRMTIYHHPTRYGIAVVDKVRPSVFFWIVPIFSLIVAVRSAVMVKSGKASG